MSHNLRNPKRVSEDIVDVEWEHPDHGWIPYTAVNNSGEEEMQEIWDAIQDGEAGEIADAEPQPEPVPQVVSRFQAKAALLQAGLLEQVEEALQSADPVTKLAWVEAVEFHRHSPMVERWGEMLDLTAEQIDDLFREAANIKV